MATSSDRPEVLDFDSSTGKQKLRPMTDNELAQYEADVAEYLAANPAPVGE